MSNNQTLKSLALFASLLGWLATGLAVQADVVAPASLGAGAKFHMVFLSQSTTQALNSNPAVYDTIVANNAAAAGLGSYAGNPVTWRALGSFFGGPSAISRFNPTAPVFRLDGARVANNGADLWDGSIQNGISMQPNGMHIGGQVWTGTNAAGGHAAGLAPNQSIGAVPFVTPGLSAVTNSAWVNNTSNTVSGVPSFFLYAFSNELMVPAAVPESGWIGALAGAALGLVAWFRKR